MGKDPKKEAKPEPQTQGPGTEGARKVRFRDSWQALVLFVALILVGRFYAVEPFKIPTGSMEPTLIGHEDYGDRIATYKQSYRFSDPQRFDVIVFKFEDQWVNQNNRGSKNYIKRLIGLPGELIMISGGDLFLVDPDTKAAQIIRKWKSSLELQEELWYPIAQPDFELRAIPEGAAEAQRRVLETQNNRSFPWRAEYAQPGKGTLNRKKGQLEVEGELTLSYAHPATNVYVKMGRWPFRCVACPETRLPPMQAGDGLLFRDPREKNQRIRPYVAGTWRGVQCPNCGTVQFPLRKEIDQATRIIPMGYTTASKLKAKVLKQTAKEKNLELEVEILEGAVVSGDRLQSRDPSGPSKDLSGTVLALRRGTGAETVQVAELAYEGQNQKGIIELEPDGPQSPRDLPVEVECSITPKETTRFFYGSETVVGDLKLELELETLTSDGALELEVGSKHHRAGWVVSLGGPRPEPPQAEGRHEAPYAPALTPGQRHLLSLAYVDGTVVASYNGERYAPIPVAVKPLGEDVLQSVARVRFLGNTQARIFRLDLYRDLHYLGALPREDSSTPNHRQHELMREQDGCHYFEIPKDHFMALGDNSPSSQDSRAWGFVPRENLIGRAGFIWWPPSRWRLIGAGSTVNCEPSDP